MSEAKPVATPLELGTRLIREQSDCDETYPFRELISSLTYLTVTSRPDISFAVTYLSQFNNCHGKSHWSAAKRILRYLRGTMDKGISFEADYLPLRGYVDADWGNCPDDRRSFTGFVFMLNGGPISWEVKKQRTVALSSTEAEYMGLTEAAKEAIHLKRLMAELGFGSGNGIEICNDNPWYKK